MAELPHPDRYLNFREPVLFPVFVPDAVEVAFADVAADFIAVVVYESEDGGVGFETINHPFYGCATEIIPKKASFCYNRVVRRSKLSCGCGCSLNYREGEIHPL